jgi:hypothetical protein
MRFCLIAPAPILDGIGPRPQHFALAQWLERDEHYRAFYETRINEGETVIIDNGAYEGEMLDFVKLTRSPVGNVVVVAPDFLQLPKESDYVGRQFRKYVHSDLAVMQVIHDSPDDAIGFAGAMRNAWGDWIGLPKWNRSRVALLAQLQQANLLPNKPIHLLGRNSDEEIVRAAKLGCVTSIDSSWPWDGPANPTKNFRDTKHLLAKMDQLCLTSK